LRFAVRGPGIPDASPRSHRMPCGDVPGRVHVSVQRVSAGHAAKQGLALAAARCDVPARRAKLARVRGTYFLHPAGGLVLQAPDQQTPPGSHDLPVEAGLLPHVPARLLNRTVGGAGHVPDLEILDADHVEPPSDARRRLLAPVLADIRAPGLEPGDRLPDPLAPLRAALSPGQLPLQPPQPPLLRCGKPRAVQQLSGRQGSAYGHAPVDADGLARSRPLDGLRDDSECHMPAPGPVHGHPKRLHVLRYLPGPAEPHPSGLGHPDLAHVPVQSAHMPRFDMDDAKPLISACLPPRRAPVRPGEEVRHCLVVVADRLLLHDHAAPGQPRVIRPGFGELAAAPREPGHRPASWPPVRLLLNAQVPHIPGVRAVPEERRSLGSRRHQSVPGHAATVAAGHDILPRCAGHRIPPRPEGRGFLRRFR